MSENNKYLFSQLFCIGLSIAALTAPAAAQASPVGAGTMTSGRLIASTTALVGVIGVVVGGLAVFRPTGRFGVASGQLGGIVALTAGLISAVIGGYVAATAGGLGTGGGLAGAVIALVLGLIAIGLGGLALSRSSRTA